MISGMPTRARGAIIVLAVVGLVAATGCANSNPQDPGDGGNPPPPDTQNRLVQLAWDAPTENADGSAPVTDLMGYTVCYGQSSNNLDTCVDTGSGTTFDLTLRIGSTYYLGVKAYDRWRNESELSNILAVTLTAAGQTVVAAEAGIAGLRVTTPTLPDQPLRTRVAEVAGD